MSIIQELQKQQLSNYQKIAELKNQIENWEKQQDFNGVLAYFLSESFGFNFEEQKQKMLQTIDAKFKETCNLEMQNNLLNLEIHKQRTIQLCEKNHVSFLGEGKGLTKIDGVTATFKCQFCGRTFSKDLSQIRRVSGEDTIQMVAEAPTQDYLNRKIIQKGLNILEVNCTCGGKHMVYIDRKF